MKYLAADNPFDGLVPDFTIFGAEFTQWWQKLFVGIWAVCIIIAGSYLLISLLGLRRAHSNNMPGQVDEAKGRLQWSAVALGGLVGFAVIMTAIFTILG